MSRASAQLLRLERAVSRLAREVRGLRTLPQASSDQAIRWGLRRHGLAWKKVLHDGCLLPRTPSARTACYELLRHYSFRLFLRDVIKHRERFTAADLQRYCSPATARRYVRWLVAQRLVAWNGRYYRVRVDVTSFGPTLEWFVAEVLQREYGIPTAWGVRLNAARAGGDYDVIGFQDGACIYVETKSSPPRNIEVAQVRAFFDRLEALRPHVAIFLNDTQLRMSDKLVVLFRAELRRRLGRRAAQAPVRRLVGEVFAVGAHVFIANSDPDLIGNIGACLAQHFRHGGLVGNARP